MADTVEHQPRERAVMCRRCAARETWAHDAVCDVCKSEWTDHVGRLRDDRAQAYQACLAAEDAVASATSRYDEASNAYMAADRRLTEFLQADPW